MATLREYFDTDFQKVLNVANTLTFSSGNNEVNILTRVHQDFDSNTKYLSVYIPQAEDSFQVIVGVLNNLDKALAIGDGVEIQSGLPGEQFFSSKALIL